MRQGFISRMRCKKKDIDNLKWGFRITKKIADLNIGQSIITGNRVVVSVEGIEGTDNMIDRSAPYILKKNYFIKAAKKGHNPAFDLPGFGLETLKSLNSIGIKIIGLEMNSVLVLEMERVIDFADKNKMMIYGI